MSNAAKSNRRTSPGLSQRGGSWSILPCTLRACLLDLLCGLWLIPGRERERERESTSGLGGAALLFFCLIWLSDGKDWAPCKNISTQPWDLNVPSQHSLHAVVILSLSDLFPTAIPKIFFSEELLVTPRHGSHQVTNTLWHLSCHVASGLVSSLTRHSLEKSLF